MRGRPATTPRVNAATGELGRAALSSKLSGSARFLCVGKGSGPGLSIPTMHTHVGPEAATRTLAACAKGTEISPHCGSRSLTLDPDPSVDPATERGE